MADLKFESREQAERARAGIAAAIGETLRAVEDLAKREQERAARLVKAEPAKKCDCKGTGFRHFGKAKSTLACKCGAGKTTKSEPMAKNATMGYGPGSAMGAVSAGAGPMTMAEGDAHPFTGDHVGRCTVCREKFSDILHHAGKKVGDFTGFAAGRTASNGRDGGLMGVGPSYSVPITDARTQKAEPYNSDDHEDPGDNGPDNDLRPGEAALFAHYEKCATCRPRAAGGKGGRCPRGAALDKAGDCAPGAPMEKKDTKEGLTLAGAAIPPPAPGKPKIKLPGMTAPGGSVARLNQGLSSFKSVASTAPHAMVGRPAGKPVDLKSVAKAED
jgi:hypothetical protein